MKNETFDESLNKNVDLHYDVMLCGVTVNTNYGALITYYALYNAIKSLGYTVIMKDSIPKNVDEESLDHARRFALRNYILTSRTDSKDYNKLADTFILGSDQIWNYSLFKEKDGALYLDFVNDDKKKIAYAASFGFNKLTLKSRYPQKYGFITSLMKRMDNISIREVDGVDLCERSFQVDAVNVMDPVFLLNRTEYSVLADKTRYPHEDKYITSYYLTPNEEKISALCYCSKELGLPMYNMTSGNPKRAAEYISMLPDKACSDVGIEEWLYNIKNSEFVITDSYHCLCFSIIFKKRFVIIQNKWAPSRIESLLTMLGLKHRWLNSAEEIIDNPVLHEEIDYDKVYEILNRKIFDSYSWLSKALSDDKKISFIKNIDANSGDYAELRTITDTSSYFQKLNMNKDIVIMCLIHGKSSPEETFKYIKLPGIGPRSKKLMVNGFSMISDFKGTVNIKSFKTLNKLEYCTMDMRLSLLCQSEKYYSQYNLSEFYFDVNGKRQIYTCEKEGFYLMSVSLSKRSVVDLIRIPMDKTDSIEHLL
ncbi:MAG: polysaccharide pyruvyl transferase family protein [Oscillospiraceae bacterium]